MVQVTWLMMELMVLTVKWLRMVLLHFKDQKVQEFQVSLMLMVLVHGLVLMVILTHGKQLMNLLMIFLAWKHFLTWER